jgi:hypothetical protein
MFEHLIVNAVTWDFEQRDSEERKDKTKNFRLILLNILQNVVYFRIQRLLSRHFTPDVSSIINNDIGRARAWAKFYATTTQDEDNSILPHRTFNFRSLKESLKEEGKNKKLKHA